MVMPSDLAGGCLRFWWVLLLVAWPAPLVQAAERPLLWAADAEGGAPFVFINPQKQGENIGFEVDLVEALAKELGREIQFKQYPYDSLALGLGRTPPDFDFALNGIEVTPDRQRLMRLSRPYYLPRLQLVARKGETRFTDLAGCKSLGLTVGTLGETASSRLLDQMGIESRVYDGQAEPYQDLQLGRIDAVLLDLPVAIYYAKGNGKLEFMGEAFGKGAYAAMFRKDQEELAEQFDAAILKLAKNGELQRIYEKWQLWNDDQLALADDQPPLTDVLKESGRLFTLSYYLPELLKAAVVTIEISIVSMALAMLIGLVVSVARLYGPLLLQWLAMIYVEFFRGIPVLLLLYVIYYGLPTAFGFALNPFTAAVIAFGLNYGAYEAEIYRAGIAAVPQGQWEAAISLGMSPLTTFRRIIFPQALRTIIPPVTNDFVALFKDTSLVSAIAVVELTKQYQLLSKSSLKYMEIGLVTAILYLAMSVPLGLLARRLEQAWGKGHA